MDVGYQISLLFLGIGTLALVVTSHWLRCLVFGHRWQPAGMYKVKDPAIAAMRRRVCQRCMKTDIYGVDKEGNVVPKQPK